MQREAAETRVTELVRQAGGRIAARADIPEIRYTSLLASIPADAAERILNEGDDISVINSSSVFFLRPQCVADVSLSRPEDTVDERSPDVAEPQSPRPDPLAALLDGLPVQRHALLDGQLIVDDPDGWEDEYPVRSRVHGTAMASAILHGDLSAREPTLQGPLYVRPIMRPDLEDTVNDPPPERIPGDVLAVDLVHRALRRMFDGEGDEPPSAPTVRYVNISIGDLSRPFDRFLSPWARLLDWWAWERRVLFLVSAGNFTDPVEIRADDPDAVFESPEDLERCVVQSYLHSPYERRLLAPAEAINVLTVGADHLDASEAGPQARQIDLLSQSGIPSPLSRFGPGHGKSVKPEILLPGGRQLYYRRLGTDADGSVAMGLSKTTHPPGVRVAAPGNRPGELDRMVFDRGTSFACALATRAAVRLHEVLLEIAEEAGDGRLETDTLPLLVRALLVHGARWGGIEDRLQELGFDLGRSRRSVVSKMMGYGIFDWECAANSTDQRVTLVGTGRVPEDGADRYSIPLPESLRGYTEWRRLGATVAWFSPTNPKTQRYRMAQLECSLHGVDREVDSANRLLGTTRRSGPDLASTKRGTVQLSAMEHDRRATTFDVGDELFLQVNCRKDGAKLPRGLEVPYGLAVTLEVAADVDIPLFEEIRNSLRVPVRPG